MPAIHREVLYAPVSAPELIPDRRSTRREFGAADDDVVIVHASRFEEWKGHVALIEALTQVTGPWRLWVAGAPQRPHEHNYARELRQRVEAHGLAGRVTWLGARTDIGRVLAAADIHCQPNTAPEPFGIAFIEALYAGLPVVTTDFGGAVEIVTSECGTLVPPGDASGLSRALQRLVDDGAARRRLGAAGPQRARALCDPTRQIDELERLIA
jgi:glycosyltransferase involved in cell wall biosynthesis